MKDVGKRVLHVSDFNEISELLFDFCCKDGRCKTLSPTNWKAEADVSEVTVVRGALEHKILDIGGKDVFTLSLHEADTRFVWDALRSFNYNKVVARFKFKDGECYEDEFGEFEQAEISIDALPNEDVHRLKHVRGELTLSHEPQNDVGRVKTLGEYNRSADANEPHKARTCSQCGASLPVGGSVCEYCGVSYR